MADTVIGKKFENEMRKQLETLEDVAVIRLYDTTNGFRGVNNPCDLIIYKKPKMIMLECKTIKGHLLNFNGHIRENQWDKLLYYSRYEGIEAGILVWFRDYNKTYYINIEALEYMSKKGKKSFDCHKDIPTIILYGKKKKVFYDYYMERFVKELVNEE